MVYLFYASTPKNKNLYFYGLSQTSVLLIMPMVENYSHAIAFFFPEDTQGKIEALKINLTKEIKMVLTSKGIVLSIF